MDDNSILTSIKKLLGIDETYTIFDRDLIIHINSVLAILTQLGVGPSNGFLIEDKYATWFDFLPNDSKLVPIKSYVHLKVRLLFDPPMSSSVMASIQEMIKELEWRINVLVDPGENIDDNQKKETGYNFRFR